MSITHGSLFSGVGGLDVGFEAAGIHTVWQCEIDRRCRSVLARHWPKAKLYEDVTTLDGATIEPVEIISFGSPCQDLSVAGKRAGFSDGTTRSSLYFEATRIIKEMLDATNGKFPRFAVWENVRGALSSNEGADFEAALQALADIGAMDLSWRLVNTCHFGPPQRRLRAFVVADFGGESAGEVLAEPTRVLWHPHKVRATGAESAENSEGCTDGSRRVFTKDKRAATATDDETWVDHRPSPTLNNFDGGEVRATTIVVEPVYIMDGLNITIKTDKPHHTIRTGMDSADSVFVPTPSGYRPRRLTPKEYERLQGWPDDHTRWDDTGKELSDSARYKMCGNGISAPVAQWIGQNIAATLSHPPSVQTGK